MPRKPDNESSPVADFERSLDALEQLVEKMEHGEMSLEESLAAYERAAALCDDVRPEDHQTTSRHHISPHDRILRPRRVSSHREVLSITSRG